MEDAPGRTVLPLGRRSLGAQAMTGDFSRQVDGVQHEPGVRSRL